MKRGRVYGKQYQTYRTGQIFFGQGTHYEIYKLFGAHPGTQRKKEGVFFAVWAPNAKAVSVVGDFNGWNPEVNVMKCDNDMGIYQLFIPKVREGDLYKLLHYYTEW